MNWPSSSSYNAGDLLWLGDWGAGWIVALACVGALILGLSAYDLWTLRPGRRLTLLGLRASVYGLAVLMLLEPALDLKHISPVKNHAVILVDQSRSMALKSEDPEQTRHERASRALERALGLMRSPDRDHEVHVLGFGRGAQPLAGALPEPTQEDTDLLTTLEDVKARLAGKELAGVLLISDGIDHGALGRRARRGEPLDAASVAALQSLGSPIHTFAASSDEGVQDVAITRVLHDDFAFVHNKVSVEVELSVVGVAPTTLELELRREGQLIQTRQVTTSPQQSAYKISFEFVPKRIGKEIYTVSAPRLPDEALWENNQHAFMLKVIRDKVRALQVVGRPSWDVRFLRSLLKRNPNVDLISFFILRTPSNVQRVPADELSLIPFPTQELFEQELGSFDLIIFQNFNFGPYNMRQYLPEIAQFVRHGGGFAMVGGELSFGAGGYAGTPLEDILPVALPGRGQDQVDERAFSPSLTEAGQRHPITQLAFDPQTNEQLWAQLPQQQGTNLVGAPRQDATVLLRHPSQKVKGQPMPVLSVWEVERGRAMALTTDSSWRWGFESLSQGGTPREYQLFWNNAIRWLIKDPELKLLKIELTQDTWAPSSQAPISVRVSRPDYSPDAGAKGQLIVTRRSLETLARPSSAEQPEPTSASRLTPPPTRPASPSARQASAQDPPATGQPVATLDFEANASGQAELRLALPEPGAYDLRATVKNAAGQLLEDHSTLLVVPQVHEHRDIVPRPDLLAAIARATEGQALSLPRDALDQVKLQAPRAVTVNRRRVIQLWDSALTFALILTLLGAEWSLRRRWGRL